MEPADIFELTIAFTVPLGLNAVVKLGVIDILSQEPEGATLSAEQIASRIKGCKDRARGASHLYRILRMLATRNILSEDVVDGQHRFGMTDLCRALLPLAAPVTELAVMPWFHLHEAVLDGSNPFFKAHGKSFYEVADQDPEFGQAFHGGMDNISEGVMDSMLEACHFQGIHTLLDVGGGHGASLCAVRARYPHIKCINFDLPHVITQAQPIEGVEHIAGDMFKDELPKADAIFMKWILHNWTDEECVELLKNCAKSIPSDGKIIVVERLLHFGVDKSRKARLDTTMDLCMLIFLGGQERSLEQYTMLAKAAGFNKVTLAASQKDLSIMELYRS